MCFANTFSQSVACLFILFMLFLKEKKILIWMKSNLSFYSGMNYTLGIKSKKPLPNPKSQRLTPPFYFKNFIIILALIFGSLVYFQLIFYMV